MNSVHIIYINFRVTTVGMTAMAEFFEQGLIKIGKAVPLHTMKVGMAPLILNFVVMPQPLYPKHVRCDSPTSSCVRKATMLKHGLKERDRFPYLLLQFPTQYLLILP